MTSTRVLNDKPDWERDAQAWPNRQYSRFLEAGGLRWHVQIAGEGPVLLLIHGTAAANHSWGALLPLLAKQYCVIAPDLPGHGFTSAPDPARLSLPGMAAALKALLLALDQSPQVAVGHSAGAAILARMCLDGQIDPQLFVSLNGALLPLRGLPGKVFSPVAKLLARSSLVPRIVGHDAKRQGAVERLVDSTGSHLDARGVALYRLLVSSPGHVAAALNMMANWNLDSLARDLPRLQCNLLLLVGSQDQTIPPSEAERLHRLLPGARIQRLDGLGHLAHEEQAETVAQAILNFPAC
ncbi:alpha/beta fold hydrolase BchO [Thiorhodovibrio frisius]|uniref:Putative magnesium chelatase accessory protein n=1 Tax=Thiorhodovibrio frisius TaxID=631362 RepID=H8YWU3_9GAMM|nr:alpha/beta fold hydrolase BchO [Thiorhodovibrio frisius]EIC22919.1 putative magnesium chelatase accessory protein [Thiorhodovibrio frisius]WPL22822.1 magnesium-chelatase 30 kDa subunit [Thiorhodovibrio frisius]